MNYKIYKLTNDQNQIYIGSTNLDLTIRLRRHKTAFKRYVENKCDLYCTAFEILKGTGIKIECVEELVNIAKFEAKTKENQHIKNFDCVNKNKACLTTEEKLAYQKQYYQDNKEELKAKQKDYNNKYYHENKQYWKTEEFKQKQKEYYKQNKDRIKQRVKANVNYNKKHTTEIAETEANENLNNIE